MNEEKDLHSGCEECGKHITTEYTAGRGYVCDMCLNGEDDPHLGAAYADPFNPSPSPRMTRFIADTRDDKKSRG